MPKECEDQESSEQPLAHEEANGTLYAMATDVMKDYITVYLDLAKRTKGFSDVGVKHVQHLAQRTIILSGINSPLPPSETSPSQVVEEWKRMKAVRFEVEPAITCGVYIQLRARAEQLLDKLQAATKGFMEFPATYISSNPQMLPILQRLANISSKADLKRQIGNVSDNAVSEAAAERLADILNRRQPGRSMSRAQLVQSIEPTLEGIVRDLVGRVLLESIVANALDKAGVPYKTGV
jgi:hypothetical protein